MAGSHTLTYTTYGSDSLDCLFSPSTDAHWQLEEVRFHLPKAAPSSKHFTIMADNGDDTSLDVVFCKVAVTTSITDIVFQPDNPHVFRAQDAITITWPSTGGLSWGTEIKWTKL